MSITATLARRLAVAALVLCTIAAAGIAVLVATAHRAEAHVIAGLDDNTAGVTAPTDPFLSALVGDSDLPANADELLLAADRVCEGMTAGESLLDMADGIAVEFGVDDVQAHEFVKLAATIHCVA